VYDACMCGCSIHHIPFCDELTRTVLMISVAVGVDDRGTRRRWFGFFFRLLILLSFDGSCKTLGKS